MSRYSIKWWDSPELKKILISFNPKKRGILRVLSAPVRYINSKVKSVYKKLVEKESEKNWKWSLFVFCLFFSDKSVFVIVERSVAEK